MTIITGSDDCDIKIWNSLPMTLIKILKGHQDYVTSIIYVGNNLIVSSSGDSTIIAWDINSPDQIIKPKSTFQVGEIIYSLLYLKEYKEISNLILLGSEKGLKMFNIDSGQVIKTYDKKATRFCTNLFDYSFIAKNVVFFSSHKYINFFNIETGLEVKKLKGHDELIHTLNHFKYNSENYIATIAWDLIINIWHINKSDINNSTVIMKLKNDLQSWVRSTLVVREFLIISYGNDKNGKIWKLNFDTKEFIHIKNLVFESDNVKIALLEGVKDKFSNNKIIVSLSEGKNLTNYMFKV